MERDKMWVCEHCLWAIESREGRLAIMPHYVDEEENEESKCDWCEQLVELVDEEFFIAGIAEAPYGCWAIDDAVAIVAEYRKTGDQFWCHAGRDWVEDMREASKSVYEDLMKGVK